MFRSLLSTYSSAFWEVFCCGIWLANMFWTFCFWDLSTFEGICWDLFTNHRVQANLSQIICEKARTHLVVAALGNPL